MTRSWGTIAVGAALGVLGCTGGSDDAPDSSASRLGPPWAGPAVELFDSMAEAFDGADHVAAARFFSAGGSLDLTAWGSAIATTPEQIDRVVRQVWFMRDPMARRATVEVEQLFVARDGAVVRWYAYDRGGVHQWAQLYVMSDDSRITSRVYEVSDELFFERGYASTGTVELLRGLYTRYVEVWSSRDAVALSEVYRESSTVRDGLTGETWSGLAEIGGLVGTDPSLQVGPSPGVWVYQHGGRIEAIAVVHVTGDCPRLEARRWIVESARIVDETRYAHVLSARRCDDPPAPGWWDSFEAPTGYDGVVTFEIEVGDRSVSLVNADASHEAFTRWLLSRFADADLPLPDVATIWFPPSADCTSRRGLARSADERAGGEATVVICFDGDELLSDVPGEAWSPKAAGYGLHELAHVWTFERLDDDARAAFVARAGLPSWDEPSTEYGQRGVEHAASTIAWGLGGDPIARYPVFESPPCGVLVDRFELLTGRAPLTGCDEAGG